MKYPHLRLAAGWWRAGPGFTLALCEALLETAPVFLIQIVAIYPLVAVGQGQEAMRALLDPGPANISPFLFPLALGYACVLTASFLFFLLGPWNFAAGNGARAFCRIWVPATLTLAVGLLWPVAAEMRSDASTLFDASIGLVNGAGVLVLAVMAWWQTKPAVTSGLALFLGGGVVTLAVLFVVAPIAWFYGACFLAVTVFCVLVRDDFRDGNPGFRPWATTYPVGLTFAAFLALAIWLLSRTSVAWRMFLGTPTIVVCGFSFLLALVFLLTALLSRVSPVLVRAGWLLLAAALVVMPLNNEPLRALPETPGLADRLPASAHFTEWIRARPDALAGDSPYPVFFVAAEGGGVRAAYWSATLLAALEERHPGFGRHVYAISGVSGGSLGAAIFAATYREALDGVPECAPWVAGGDRGLRPCVARLFQWDLLGPPLSGFLLHDLPFGWRGARRGRDLERGMELAWRGTMMGDTVFEEPFQALWGERPYEVPSLLLNTTSADDGGRIVVSNLLARGELAAEADVESLLGRPLRLSTAAFLSARFPVISPVATFEAVDGRSIRLVDGGYFNNSGVAAIADLLRAVLPAAEREAPGDLRPVVLVLASDPPAGRAPHRPPAPGGLAGSLAGALLAPVAVLQATGDAHDATYLAEVTALVGREGVIADLRPAAGAPEVALGWTLSSATRCAMDGMVNEALEGTAGAAAISRFLGSEPRGPAVWTSCDG